MTTLLLKKLQSNRMRFDFFKATEYDDTTTYKASGNRMRLDVFKGIEYDESTT